MRYYFLYTSLFLASLPAEGRLDAMGNGRSALVDTLRLHWAKETLAMHLAQLGWLLIKLDDTRTYEEG